MRDGRVKQPMSNYINAKVDNSGFDDLKSNRNSFHRRHQSTFSGNISKRQYTETFNLDLDHNIKYLSFSQRRFNGFRGQIEFDKKRILVSSKNEFSIYGYESYMSDVNYELLRVTMGDSDEIRYIDFIEDVVPKYLFMIVNNRDTKQSNLFIKLIKIYSQKKF